MSIVLLATDGSDLATAAMAKGVGLLGRDHRFITLAVVPPVFVPTASSNPMDTHPTLEDPELEEQIEAEQRAEQGAEALALDAALGIEAQHLIQTGEPGPSICDVAAQAGAEIVVIGSHGHGWFKRVLMGSVSTYVLNHAPCPVLVIRTDDAQDQDQDQE